MAQLVKSLPANLGDTRAEGSIPGSGRSPEERNGNLFQYFCLENPMDREAWQATIHGAVKELDITDHTYTYAQRLINLTY